MSLLKQLENAVNVAEVDYVLNRVTDAKLHYLNSINAVLKYLQMDSTNQLSLAQKNNLANKYYNKLYCLNRYAWPTEQLENLKQKVLKLAPEDYAEIDRDPKKIFDLPGYKDHILTKWYQRSPAKFQLWFNDHQREFRDHMDFQIPVGNSDGSRIGRAFSVLNQALDLENKITSAIENLSKCDEALLESRDLYDRLHQQSSHLTITFGIARREGKRASAQLSLLNLERCQTKLARRSRIWGELNEIRMISLDKIKANKTMLYQARQDFESLPSQASVLLPLTVASASEILERLETLIGRVIPAQGLNNSASRSSVHP